MTKTFLASVLAATLAVTSLTTAPANAGDRKNFGKFLLGAGTVLIIGGAIAQADRHRGPRVHVQRSHPPRYRNHYKPYRKHYGRGHYHPKHYGHRQSWRYRY